MNMWENSNPKLIKGGIHQDHRGSISFVNDFSLGRIKRFYTLSHPNTSIVRAWQGHKKQTRCFHVTKGVFFVACVKIDDWENPSKSLQAETFILDSKEPSVLFVPKGYANGIKALQNDSILLSFSETAFDDKIEDDEFRYDSNLWVDWKSIN
ncbi:WxcM-like domain-containing protein [Flagellimonas nanhaiensis]|nr:WxcM-like domain-containing protein [Allomuricauda nanhaiensis]